MGRSVFVEHVFGFMVSNYMEPIDMESLEKESGVSRFVITRRFREIYGLAPLRWLWIYRVMMAVRILSHQSHLKCEDVALCCGFQTVAHFNRVFKRILGRSPGSYRENPMDSAALHRVLSGAGFAPRLSPINSL